MITPPPQPNSVPYDDFPTNIDMDLVMFCLNDWEQKTCAEFFRFVHFFFAARVPNDPEITNYLIELGLAPPDDDLFTQTQTSTFSVSLKVTSDSKTYSNPRLILLVLLYRFCNINC